MIQMSKPSIQSKCRFSGCEGSINFDLLICTIVFQQLCHPFRIEGKPVSNLVKARCNVSQGDQKSQSLSSTSVDFHSAGQHRKHQSRLEKESLLVSVHRSHLSLNESHYMKCFINTSWPDAQHILRGIIAGFNRSTKIIELLIDYKERLLSTDQPDYFANSFEE